MNKIIEKLTSGRYFLTVVGGLAFLYCVWKRTLEPQAISAILTAIFLSYFNRPDRSNGKGEV